MQRVDRRAARHASGLCDGSRGGLLRTFDEPRQNGRVEPLVRAKHDRATREELNLFELVRQSPVLSQLRINVPRQSARGKKSKQKARYGHVQGDAQVNVRYREVELRPPSKYPAGRLSSSGWCMFESPGDWRGPLHCHRQPPLPTLFGRLPVWPLLPVRQLHRRRYVGGCRR
jgi:hypothetical protein